MSHTNKALVLSGGGGRGAYHIGVMEALVAEGWMIDGQGPDIIAGTSIGAINAAALASGLKIAQLQKCWLNMHTEDVHRLSTDLPSISRPLMRFMLRGVLTSDAHNGTANQPNDINDASLSSQGIFDRLNAIFHMRPFRSLLDTRPWRHTLQAWMDFERINSPQAPALLLTATDIQTGDLRVFCNRERRGYQRDHITLDHLIASSSIPTLYPWTELDGAKYWDGAVLANTPLGPVIDLGADADLDILVVMMTPWQASATELRSYLQEVPTDLAQALWLTLDWSLLASYRASIKMLRLYNQLAEAAEKLEQAASQTGDSSLRMTSAPRIIAEPTVIAPSTLLPLDMILDYEEHNHRKLFEMGYNDALKALQQRRASKRQDA